MFNMLRKKVIFEQQIWDLQHLIFVVRIPGEALLIEAYYHLRYLNVSHSRRHHLRLIDALKLNKECQAAIIIGGAQYLFSF